MAKALVSQASRQDAHNLDDLFERWLIRREEIAQTDRNRLSPDAAIEVFLPELTLDSVHTAQQIRPELVGKKTYIQSEISRIKSIRLGDGQRITRQYKVNDYSLREHEYMLSAAVSRVDHQLTTLSLFLKEQGVNPHKKTKVRYKRPLFHFFAVELMKTDQLTEQVNAFIDAYETPISLGQWYPTETGFIVQFWVDGE